MLGYDHESFWDQTPRTLSLTFDAGHENRINEHNQRAWLAWHVAGLQRAKRMPPLNSLIVRKTALLAMRDRHIAMEEQIAGLVRWVQATGGKIIYNG